MRNWIRIFSALALLGLPAGTASAQTPAAPPGGWYFATNGAVDQIHSFAPGIGTNATASSTPPIFDLADIFDGQLSLGDGGDVVLEFTNNVLGTGEAVALWENGIPEGADIYLGTSPTTFYLVDSFMDAVGGGNPLPLPTRWYTVDSVIAAHNLPLSTTFTYLQIVADNLDLGIFDSAGAHGFDLLLAAELNAVPEPGTLVLLATGVAALASRRVRSAR